MCLSMACIMQHGVMQHGVLQRGVMQHGFMQQREHDILPRHPRNMRALSLSLFQLGCLVPLSRLRSPPTFLHPLAPTFALSCV